MENGDGSDHEMMPNVPSPPGLEALPDKPATVDGMTRTRQAPDGPDVMPFPDSDPPSEFVDRLHTVAVEGHMPAACSESTEASLKLLGENMKDQLSQGGDPSLFESFRVQVFIWELVSHALQPVFLPVTILVKGLNHARNQMLYTHYLQILGICFWAAVVVHFAVSDNAFRSGPLAYDFAVAGCFYFYRVLVVSTKYGFYPPADYEEVSTGSLDSMSVIRHLLFVWAFAGTDSIVAEVGVAERRLQVDLSRYTLRLHAHHSARRKGVAFVTADRYVHLVISHVYDNIKSWGAYLGHVSIVPPLFTVSCLFIPWDGTSPFDGLTWWEVVIKVLLSITSLTMGKALCMVMGAVVMHHWRGYLFMQALQLSTAKTSFRPQLNEPGSPTMRQGLAERLSFQSPENVEAWYVSRFVLLNTGRRFDTRASLFMSYAVWALLLLLFGNISNFVSGGDYTRKGLSIALVTGTFISLLVSADLWAAKKLNNVHEVQSSQLEDEEYRIGVLLDGMRRKNKEEKWRDSAVCVTRECQWADNLKEALQAIDRTKKSLKALAHTNTIKVFGVTASADVLSFFWSVTGSVLLVGLQLFVTAER
eukprot:Hpha_TRINITY_DN13315_c0_g2::TRINITY_DN13315_c0_g2_i1::g.95269::m.95269